MAVLKDVKRIVIKVGTSTLAYPTGKANIRQMKKLVTVISDLVNSGLEVALVTSGAIGVGVGKFVSHLTYSTVYSPAGTSQSSSRWHISVKIPCLTATTLPVYQLM